MRLQDLLKLQQPATDINDLRVQSVSRRALAPRSRTDPMLEIAQEAQACFKDQVANVQQRLQREEERSLDAITDVYGTCSKEILHSKEDSLNALLAQHVCDQARQESFQAKKLADLKEVATIPSDSILFQLRDINQLDSLEATIRDEPHLPPDVIPVQFRILSRKNEMYGANNWSSTLSNTPDNFYRLLMGTVDDSYQSDHFPYMQAFAQGKDGCFWLKQNSANSYDYSNASTSSLHCAAVAAVMFHNQTDEVKTCNIQFTLSCRDFSGLYCKVDTWETLFQTTSNAIQSDGQVRFSVPPQRDVVLMAVATPYYNRPSWGRRDIVYSDFVVQFIQLGLFHLKEIATCLSR